MTSPWSAPGAPDPVAADREDRTPQPSSPWADAPAGTSVTADPAHASLQRELVARTPLFPLRPLGLGEILGAATRLYRVRPRQVLVLSAVVFAIASVLQLVLTGASLMPFMGSLQMAVENPATQETLDLGTSGADALGMLAGTLGTSIVSVIAVQVLTTALAPLALGEATGRRVPDGQVWAAVRRHGVRAAVLGLLIAALAVILVALAVGLGVLGAVPIILNDGNSWLPLIPIGIGALLAAVAALWLATRTALATPALVLEGIGPLAALRRSFALTRGRRMWRVLGIVLLIQLLVGAATQIIGGVVGFAATLIYIVVLIATDFQQFALAASIMLVLTMLGTFIASTLVQPFAAAAATVLYADVRMRDEGWDIELTRDAARTHDAVAQAATTSGSPNGADASGWRP